MEYLEFENYRAFKKRQKLKLANLTLLLGRNGDGKSSLVRFFPLLKQTYDSKSRAPFLWMGDYVDFGEFSNVKTLGSSLEDGVKFCFGLRLNKTEYRRLPVARRFHFADFNGKRHDSIGDLFSDIQIEVDIFHDEKIGTFTKRAIFQFGSDVKCVVTFNSRGQAVHCLVNEYNYSKFLAQITYRTNSIIPFFQIKKTSSNDPGLYLEKNDVLESLKTSLIKYFNKNMKPETVDQIISNMPLLQKGRVENTLREFTESRYWNPSFKNISTEEDSEISSMSLFSCMPQLLEVFDSYMRSISQKVKYIAPVRANVSRYYRNQELAIDNIDQQGLNVPMFISSLDDSQLESFKVWTRGIFDVEIFSKKNGAHIELMLKDCKTGKQVNLADTGYGYSQLIPILAQLWSLISKTKEVRFRDRVPVIVAIEQPELHLHPEAQAKLAKLFNAVLSFAKESSINIKFVVETHSEALIEQLGRDIQDKIINRSDVALNIISKEEDTSVIREASYDDEGILVDWPIGFFGF